MLNERSQKKKRERETIGNRSAWHGECSPAPDLENQWGVSRHTGPEPTDRSSCGESGLHCT